VESARPIEVLARVALGHRARNRDQRRAIEQCGAAGVFDGERYDLVARVEQILHLGAVVLEA
jgi:hypothetical protein